jgi:ribulose 1,5-bisphosphate synthetase/thiazole synthase
LAECFLPAQTQKFPSLQKDEGEVDVVVVGGGLAGMLIAYELSKNGGWVDGRYKELGGPLEAL